MLFADFEQAPSQARTWTELTHKSAAPGHVPQGGTHVHQKQPSKAAVQMWFIPPSTTTFAPSMKLLSGEARNATTAGVAADGSQPSAIPGCPGCVVPRCGRGLLGGVGEVVSHGPRCEVQSPGDVSDRVPLARLPKDIGLAFGQR